MTDPRQRYPIKANGPGPTEPNTDATKATGPDRANDQPRQDQTKTNAQIINVPALKVNRDRDWNAERLGREAEEQARWSLIRRNSAVRDRIFKYSLGKFGTSPSVNRIKCYVGRMAFEFPLAGGNRVTPRTVAGTLIGHDSQTVVTPDSMRNTFLAKHQAASTHIEKSICYADFRLATTARRAEYTIDEDAIDRRYLFEGQFLFTPKELERMLSPRCLTARFDYAARLHLSLRRLGLARPQNGHMRNAIARVEEWARLNAERLPDCLPPTNERGNE